MTYSTQLKRGVLRILQGSTVRGYAFIQPDGTYRVTTLDRKRLPDAESPAHAMLTIQRHVEAQPA